MEALFKDLRYAQRALRRRPVFTAVAVLSLALGIGANGAIFSVVNGVLFKPLSGVRDESRLVRVYMSVKSFEWPLGISAPNYQDLRAGTEELFSSLGGHSTMFFGTSISGEAPRIAYGNLVYGDYFTTLGATPARGRFFGETEAAAREPVVVVSHDFWRDRLEGDPGVVGRELRIDGQSFVVVGVAPVGFFGVEVIFAPDLWVPLESLDRFAPLVDERFSDALKVTARLRPGVTLDQVSARLAPLSAAMEADYPENEGASFHVMPTTEARVEAGLGGPMKLLAAILLALVALVLLIACANVANLMMARARARQRELSLRVAIGAGRSQLIRQLMIESLVLTAAGGALGLLVAVATTAWMESSTIPGSMPLRLEFSPDSRVFLFTGAVALFAGLLFGLLPALQASRADPVRGLRSSTLGGGARSKLRGGSALVVVQVALSLVLLMGAGLFLRSLRHAETADFGLDPRGVAAMTVDLSMLGRSEDEGRVFFEEIERRFSEISGVEAVSRATWVPLGWSARGVVADTGIDLGEELGTEMATLGSFVGPDYFDVVKTPILEGRAFTRDDDQDRPAVAIVNQTYAAKVWPGQSALGQQLRLSESAGEPATIVGVAANGKYRLLGESPRPYIYLPVEQHYQGAVTLLLRSHQPVASVLEQALAELRRREPELAVQDPGPLAATITSRALGPIRMIAALAGSFGLVGLALAAIGLYGVMAFGVAQRHREIGVRMALGARSGLVLRQVLERGLLLAAIGVVLGGLASLAVTRLLGRFLVGVSASDPLTYGAVIAGLVAVSVVASLAPAVRAARIDPVRTLKAE